MKIIRNTALWRIFTNAINKNNVATETFEQQYIAKILITRFYWHHSTTDDNLRSYVVPNQQTRATLQVIASRKI